MYMALRRITRHEEFEAAHMLDNYGGACKNLHGHSYKIEVTIEGPQVETGWGFVMDFNEFKSIIKEVIPDHKFIASQDKWNNQSYCPEVEIVRVLQDWGLSYVLYPFEPSAENMVGYFAEQIQYKLDEINPDIKVVEVKLWETRDSYATWHI